MKLGIIGLGVIGRAVQESADCQTVGADKGDSLLLVLDCDAIAVCVGTPSLPSGQCDTSSLEEVLSLLQLHDYPGPVVSHSTAPPAFYKKHSRPNLVHVPEFVRGDHAAYEYRRQERLIIGGDFTTAKRVFELWTWLCPYLTNFIHMSIESAALAKYMANSLLATKVALLNEVKPLADSIGADWKQITSALSDDQRLGNTHWQVPGPDGKLGFGGACFPKDVAALMNQGHDMPILKAVLSSNEAVRG